MAVTVFADGESRAITTNADTVEEVLNRADIPVDNQDLVEPSLDSDVSSDTFNINVYRARPVLLQDENGDSEQIMTGERDKRSIAEQAEDIDVYEEDELEINLITDFVNTDYIGYEVLIERSTPVNLIVSGQEQTVRTHAETVAELFEEREMEVGDDDDVEPGLNQSITADMQIVLSRVGYETVTEEVEIEPSVEEIRDNDMPMGEEEVEAEGRPGIAEVTYDVKYKDGEEVRREEIDREVLEEPQDRVVVVGNHTEDYDSGDNRSIGQDMAADRGWTGSEWNCLEQLWTRESNWDHTARNPTSGAYGIPQALLSTHTHLRGSDYMNDPAAQIEWGMDYIEGRYSTPCGAWDFFQSRNWY